MKKLMFVVGVFILSTSVFAGEGVILEESSLKYFAYFLAVGIAAYGGTASQSKAASAALEGMGRNPAAADKIFTPMLLSLAFMESLVIFTLSSIFFI